jgi:hypothetical protein
MPQAVPVDATLATCVAILQGAFFLAGILGVWVGVATYRANSARERARWLTSLYEKFYEREDLKRVRDALDCDPDSEPVKELVASEPAEFTDYLNFFEFVFYLVDRGQMSREDVDGLFDYYLRCLRRHATVRAYLRRFDKSFERLAGNLDDAR